MNGKKKDSGPSNKKIIEQMEEGKSGAGQGMGAAWGRGRVMGMRKWGFWIEGGRAGLGGHSPGPTLALLVPGIQPWSGSRGLG